MSEIIKMILDSLLYVVGLGIGAVIIWAGKTYVIPWLKVKLGEARYKRLKERVADLMAAAEQKFNAELAGKAKSEWVIEQIEKKWPGVMDSMGAVDAASIQSLIDGLMKPLEDQGLVNADKAA